MSDIRPLKAQRSTKSLKVLRYEDVVDGIPPRRVASGPKQDTPPPSPRSQLISTSSDHPIRPRTSPAPSPRTLDLSHELKRDSGIAPSIATTGAASTDSHLSFPNAGGAARGTTLPTILVQDVQDEASFEQTERSRSPLGKRKSKEKPQRQAKSMSPPRSHRGPAPPPPEIKRIASFKGIQTSIPTSSEDDINLDDLASDKVTFSQRGSLLFGGKKMQELIASQGEGTALVDGRTTPVPTEGTETSPEDIPAEPSIVQEHLPFSERPEPPRRGLVSGRRQPSVHMLQAAILGGRVLSVEEITFSLRVRSMYEHGDERAADWVNSIDQNISRSTTPMDNVRDTPTPDTTNGHVNVSKTRQRDSSRLSQQPNGSDVRASYYSKQSNELAGGIEDWEDMNGRAVDRFGFIHEERVVSRFSADSGPRREREPMHRVATSLRVEGQRDRKLTRGPSSARSSRSVPPPRQIRDWTIKKGPGSIHSTHSHVSRSNPFRSRTRKVLAEASDMLTTPPMLVGIDEHDDAGKTASSLKQREWAREEKWKQMARPVQERGSGMGGGMRFEFDTTDSKLVERTWKGIPDRWRATAWHSFLSTSAKRRGSYTTDEELIGQFHELQEMSSADDVQIDVDVPRTINMHIMFRRRYRGGQRLLFRVLHAVSVYFPDIGYVQGMASLASTFLCYYDEERAFVMMVRLWQLRGLEQLFCHGFEGLMAALSEFESEWLHGGDVALQLEQLGITSTAYGTRWYLTLFNMSIPFPAQLRVWDVFMLLGDASSSNASDSYGGADLDVLHSTSAALIDATRDIILDSDFENCMKVLTSFVPIKDEDLLMRVARAEWNMKKKRAGRKV